LGGFAVTETIETLEEIKKMTLDFLTGKTSILRIEKKKNRIVSNSTNKKHK